MASNTSTAAAGAAAEAQQHKAPTYTSKWGNVVLLDRQNYPTFASTCRTALLAAQTWAIVKDTEKKPSDLTTPDGKDWVLRRDRALQIMFNSTCEEIRDTLDSYIEEQDASGLWTHLATYNQAANELFATKVLTDFSNDSYKAPNDTI